MFNIGKLTVGENNKTFIIAEAGVNHNGSIENAYKLVDEAYFAGADAVKFQTFFAEELVTGYAAMAEYQKNNLGIEESQLNMLKALELNFSEFELLKKYCESKGIIFLSTPFDFKSLDFLQKLQVDAYKVSSADLNNIPFIKKIAGIGKPVILSSGMATLGETEAAIKAVREEGNEAIAMMHCTSNYPCSFQNVNLKAIDTIKQAFQVITGYSDHTEGIEVAIGAVARGASIIEKHFTLDKSMVGPDHKASLNPVELKSMVMAIRNIEKALGSGIKMYNSSELDTIKAARKSIVAARDINVGEKLTKDMLEYKRPGTGTSPDQYKYVIGKNIRIPIKKDEQILFTMLE